jgi:plasmid stabilization system protein ParE
VKLVFDAEALADLEDIFHWIAKDDPRAARAVVDRLFESVQYLALFPQMGHRGRDDGTFEWVVPRLPYIVVYEVNRESEQVVVIAVVHGAQDREDR